MKRYTLLFEIMQDDCSWNETFVINANTEEEALKKCKLKTCYYKLIDVIVSD